MRRREFITLIGGAAAWPLATRAQQERMRHIGVLANLAAEDPQTQTRHAAFLQALQQLGWTLGRNVRSDYRWTAGKIEVALAGSPVSAPVQDFRCLAAERSRISNASSCPTAD